MRNVIRSYPGHNNAKIFVIIFISGIFIFIFGITYKAYHTNYHDNAVENFVNYSKETDLKYKSYWCENWPNDNYVYCEYKDENNNSHTLKCSAGGFMNFHEGCMFFQVNNYVENY